MPGGLEAWRLEVWRQGPGGLEAWWPGCEHLVTKAILCQKFKAKLMENKIVVEADIFLEICLAGLGLEAWRPGGLEA